MTYPDTCKCIAEPRYGYPEACRVREVEAADSVGARLHRLAGRGLESSGSSANWRRLREVSWPGPRTGSNVRSHRHDNDVQLSELL